MNLKSDQSLQALGGATNYLDEITDKIESFSFLKQFNDQELKMLAGHMQCFAAPRGCYLFRQGESADKLIIILSGQVNIDGGLSGANTEYLIGTTIGAEAFVEEHQWGASCVAQKPTDFAVFTKDSLDEILMHSPRLGNSILIAMMQSMVVRIRSMQEVTDKELELILS